MNDDRPPVALTIAGSDSCGGAGIQADLATFAANGIHAMSVVTAVTVQNTQGVHGIHQVPPELVEQQLDALFEDIEIDAVKIGMLASREAIRAVASTLRKWRDRRDRTLPIVVDPVLSSQAGQSLSEEGCVEELRDSLLPISTLVTPNLGEASLLIGQSVGDLSQMTEAATALAARLGCAVLVTGGHLEGCEKVDVLVDEGGESRFSHPEIETTANHGTGCVLSSAIAARMALRAPLRAAVREGKAFVTEALRRGQKIGQGHGVVNPLGGLRRDADRHRVWEEVEATRLRLERSRLGALVPEVQSNLAYAIRGARAVDDVLGFPGRLVRLGEEMVSIAPASFGGSSHVARIVLAVMRHDPASRAAMNVRWSPAVLEACREAGLVMASFNRNEEPENVTEDEGSSLPFGIDLAIQRSGKVPDVIEDPGGEGKEPMIRVLAPDPALLLDKVLAIRDRLEGGASHVQPTEDRTQAL